MTRGEERGGAARSRSEAARQTVMRWITARDLAFVNELDACVHVLVVLDDLLSQVRRHALVAHVLLDPVELLAAASCARIEGLQRRRRRAQHKSLHESAAEGDDGVKDRGSVRRR